MGRMLDYPRNSSVRCRRKSAKARTGAEGQNTRANEYAFLRDTLPFGRALHRLNKSSVCVLFLQVRLSDTACY